MNKEITQENSRIIKTYTPAERNVYLVGLAGQNIMYNVVNACIMYYLQFTILIPAMAVSIIFTIARIFDALNDPIMGTLVDKTRSKYGKCIPYLRIVPIPIMIISILCYVSFGFYGDGGKVMNAVIIGWTAFTYIGWGVLYTIGDIPLWGVTSLMTESQKDREKILTAARIVAGIAGGAVMLSMQPIALGVGGAIASKFGLTAADGEKYGFLVVAIIISLIGTIMFQLTGFKVKERIAATEKTHLKDNLKIIIHNKPYVQLLISGVLGSAKSIINIVAMTIVSYYFASKSPIMTFVYMGLLGGGLFVGMFAGMGFAPKLSEKFSKKHVYNASNLIMVLPFILIFVAYKIAPHSLTAPVWIAVCFVLFAFAGAGTGALNVLQSTMIADCVDYEEYKSGRRPDALFFSGQTFLVKLQSGLATIITGIAYSIVRFSDARVAEVNAFINAGGTPRLATEYSNFMMILFLVISIPSAISCLLSVIPTWKYALDDKEHAKILAELIERRRQREQAALDEVFEGITEDNGETVVDGETEETGNEEVIIEETADDAAIEEAPAEESQEAETSTEE